MEDALEITRRLLSAFERAELEPDPERREALITFVVVGGGPTGVELAGALGDLAHHTLRDDFRAFDTSAAKILLVEGADRLLLKAVRMFDWLNLKVRDLLARKYLHVSDRNYKHARWFQGGGSPTCIE